MREAKWQHIENISIIAFAAFACWFFKTDWCLLILFFCRNPYKRKEGYNK